MHNCSSGLKPAPRTCRNSTMSSAFQRSWPLDHCQRTKRSLLVQRLTLMVLQRKRDCDKLIGPMNKKISLSWGMSRSYPTKWRYFNWCAWRRVFPNSAATDRGPMRDCRVALKCSIWFARQKMFGWWSCTGMNWGLNFLHLLGKWKWRAIFLSTL